jgi:hypothetical protein
VAGKRDVGLASPAFDLKAITSPCSIRGGWDSNLGTSYKKQLVRLCSIRCKNFSNIDTSSFQLFDESTKTTINSSRLFTITGCCDYLFCCPSVQYLTRTFHPTWLQGPFFQVSLLIHSNIAPTPRTAEAATSDSRPPSSRSPSPRIHTSHPIRIRRLPSSSSLSSGPPLSPPASRFRFLPPPPPWLYRCNPASFHTRTQSSPPPTSPRSSKHAYTFSTPVVYYPDPPASWLHETLSSSSLSSSCLSSWR